MLQTILSVLKPDVLLLVLAGIAIGNIFGCVPGLNAPIAVALALPITFLLDTIPAMALILGLYFGATSGGLVSAILLRIPGTASNVATCFDGYPLAQKGRAADAMSYGAFASFFGGIFSSIILLALAPVLAKVAVAFGPWEFFGTALLSLVLVSVMMGDKMLKSFIVICIGLLMKCVGLSPVDSVAVRYTFGIRSLEAGFNLVVVIIGVFAIPEVISTVGKLHQKVTTSKIEKKFFYIPKWKEIKENLGVMLSSSVIGTIIGIIPGMGGGAASLISYEQAKKTSKHPQTFGTGEPAGIFSCESANNAVTGGALIPMLSLGVPGDTVASVIMGALLLQGVTPGPLLSMNNPELFRAILAIAFIANIIMFLYQASTIRLMAQIARIPKAILMPIITVFCLTGTISIRNNMFDLVYVMLIAFLGYLFDKNGYPFAPFILANVLGDTLESNLRRAIMYYGTFGNCCRQISIGTVFFFLAVLLPVCAVVLRARKKAAAPNPERSSSD